MKLIRKHKSHSNKYFMINIRFLMIALFCFTTNAAAEWSYVFSSGDSSKVIYVDYSTIRKTGNLVQMWSLYDFSNIQHSKVGYSYISTLDFDEYNCSNSTSRKLSIVKYSGRMGSGKVVDSYNYNDGSSEDLHRPIVPNSIIEGLWLVACTKDN